MDVSFANSISTSPSTVAGHRGDGVHVWMEFVPQPGRLRFLSFWVGDSLPG